ASRSRNLGKDPASGPRGPAHPGDRRLARRDGMTTTTPAEARTAALQASRAKDSQDKRRRVLAAIEALGAGGAPITFPAVAKAAGVSTWLAYTEGIREHVEAARRRQTDHGL